MGVLKKHSVICIIICAIFIRLAIYIFNDSILFHNFNENLFIRDLMWLDVWGLSFILATIGLLFLKIKSSLKYNLILFIFSLFGFITIYLMLNGTPFGINGYWGDQAFRISNVLKLMTSFPTSDFYYKDLPMFYPPLFFYVLAIIGKLLSIEAYETIKIGLSILFLLGPLLLYKSWKPVIGYHRAIFVSVSTFIVAMIGYSFVLFNPYEFLGNSLFIPWWIYFIERHNNKLSSKSHYVWGGVTGALVFSTYPFPFFIGGAFLLVKTISVFLSKDKDAILATLKSWKLVIVVSVLCSWYWLPAFLAIIKFGGKPAIQEWFHVGRTGLSFDIIQFNWIGILMVTSLLYVVYKFRQKINRNLLFLFLMTLSVYLLGLFLGALDHPINILKAKTLLTTLSGVMIGLLLSNRIRAFSKNIRNVTYVGFVILLLLFVSEFHSIAKHKQIKSARTSKPQTWRISDELSQKIIGKTFLTGIEKLSVFYPVYYYSAINQHYSHPASRYNNRYELIKMLELTDSPYMMYLTMRYNKFSAIDFVMPQIKENKYYIPFTLSSYPNKSQPYKVELNRKNLENSDFFKREKGTDIFAVLNTPLIEQKNSVLGNYTTLKDSTKALFAAAHIFNNITIDGQKKCDSLLHEKVSDLNIIKGFKKSHSFDEKLYLFSIAAIGNKDSICVYFGFRANDFVYKDFRAYFHITADGKQSNYDFSLPKLATSLKPGEIFFVSRTIPRLDDSMKFSIGLFKERFRLGKPYKGNIQIK